MNDQEKLIRQIDELEEALAMQLPDDDPAHRQEILDIMQLVKARTEMYLREYGVLPYDE